MDVADEAGPTGVPIRRILLSAGPTFGTAVLFGWPLVTGGRTLLWFDTRTLAVALELELGVLIAGFGLVFAVLLPVQHRPQRIMRWIVVLGVTALFAQLGWAVDRWSGVFSWLLLVYATFGWALVATVDAGRTMALAVEVGGRWVLALACWGVTWIAFDVGTISHRNPEVFRAGAAYFTVLGIIDVALSLAGRHFGWRR